MEVLLRKPLNVNRLPRTFFCHKKDPYYKILKLHRVKSVGFEIGGYLETALWLPRELEIRLKLQNMADFQRRMDHLRRLNRIPRVIIDRKNPLEVLSRNEIRERYRFYPESIHRLTEHLFFSLDSPTRRSSPLPPLLSILVTLQFLATGAHHLLIGMIHEVSRPTVGRTIDRVLDALCSLTNEYIVFPREEMLRNTKTAFYKVAGFPNVVGCIDGTQIKIKRPTNNEVDFVNRKGYHSINVQMVCSSDFSITSVSAKWPGSVHDSRVLRESDLGKTLEHGRMDGYLLGDSGYPCKKYLLTPYPNPQTPAQERFNTALCRTRVLVEQTFGVLKRRFPCLQYGLRVAPAKCCKTTVSCVVLHNFGLIHGDIFCRPIPQDVIMPNVRKGQEDETGKDYRDHICQTYFS